MSQAPDNVTCPKCRASNPTASTYCSKCGHALTSQPLSAPSQSKAADEIYCPSCGQVIKRSALTCVKCGVRVGSEVAAVCYVPKDKTIAIILAIFFAFFTWVYTYQTDAWKFWLNLILTLVTCGWWGLVAWLWAIIEVAARPVKFYANYPWVQ